MESLQDRTAVVIGGGGGIGSGTAVGLAEAGASVVVADIDADRATRVAERIRATGGTATAATVDATDRGSLTALADAAEEAHGGVHVLCNAMGVVLDRRLDEASEQDWAWFLEFNLLAMVRSVDVFLPHLRRHPGDAHVVITSSMAGLLALPPAAVGNNNLGLYVTTKHAVVGYGEMLRNELADEGVGVSVLCPGLVEGDLGATSAANRPERHGGPMAHATRQGRPTPGAMPSDEVGRFVVKGILGNRLLVLTHPESVALLEERHQRFVADFAFYES